MESSTGLRGIPSSSLLVVLLFSPMDEHTWDPSSANATNVGLSTSLLDAFLSLSSSDSHEHLDNY